MQPHYLSKAFLCALVILTYNSAQAGIVPTPQNDDDLTDKYGPINAPQHFYYAVQFHGIEQVWAGAAWAQHIWEIVPGHPPFYSDPPPPLMVKIDATGQSNPDLRVVTGDFWFNNPKEDTMGICGYQLHGNQAYQLRGCGFTNKDASGSAAFCFNVEGGWWDPVMKPGGEGVCIIITPANNLNFAEFRSKAYSMFNKLQKESFLRIHSESSKQQL